MTRRMAIATAFAFAVWACGGGAPGEGGDGIDGGSSTTSGDGDSDADEASSSAGPGPDGSGPGSSDGSAGSEDSGSAPPMGFPDCPDGDEICLLCDNVLSPDEFTQQETEGLAVAPDGTAYLLGARTTVSGGTRPQVAKWEPACGAAEWVYRVEGEDDLWAGAITLVDGEPVFTAVQGGGAGTVLHRLSSDGEAVWDSPRLLDLPGAGVQDMVTDLDGNLVVVGAATGAEPWLTRHWRAKLDANGNELWSLADGRDDGLDQLSGVAIDADGNWYESGWLLPNAPDMAGQLWLAKRRPAGDTVWTVPPETGAGLKIAVDPSGPVVVVGVFTDMTGTSRMWMRKFDAGGNELWTVEDPSFEYAADVAVDSHGAIIVAPQRHVDTPVNAVDFWVRKYDPSGNELWTDAREEPNLKNQLGSGWVAAVAVDAEDRIFAAGSYGFGAGGLDVVLRVYGAGAAQDD